MAQDDVGFAPTVATLMEKGGVGASACSPKKASPPKQSIKSRPETREKRPARADPPRKMIVHKPSPQLDKEDEESVPTLVHR